MEKLVLCVFIVSAIASVWCKVGQDSIDSGLVVSKVDRKVDAATHLVKVSASLTVENNGKSAVKSFLYVIDDSLKDHLSFFGATLSDDDEKLVVAQTSVAGHTDKQFWRINLRTDLGVGKMVKVDVDTVFAHALRPYPLEIAQSEKQQVVLEGNVYFYSPYVTKSQTTVVTVSSTAIESYSKSPKPVSESDKTITYGPYEKREPFTQAELKVHFESSSPFLAVTSMERIIEVSHWGNIAIEEHIDLRHSGAKLKGPFSRYDYQRSQDGVSSVKSFKTVLPAAAKDVYYRDEIGNISTSNLKELDDMVELELRPRFPLFGGWKTHYYIGYNVPSYQYLFNEGDQYALKMRFVDHVFDDLLVDQITVKIILPEGSKNMMLSTPYDVVRGDNQLHYTYLDTMGRPVIVAYKSNLVEQHIQDFELRYTFKRIMLLQEPLLVVGAFYLLFLIVIIYVRLDFSITKDEAKESKMRVASLVEDVQSAQDKRSALYQSYDDAINKFKSTKEAPNFATSRKKIDGDYRQLTQQIQGLQGQLKTEGSDLADKVAELQKLDSQYKEQIQQAINAAEKLVQGKMSKQVYIDSEKVNTTKREDLYNKMESLRNGL
ncbi:dolichyl-diphosphooligosaccharide--protein glycosyltransferase subunit 1-like [Pecten maximus]|uniref:dolichyl-diphosphooligosaccharide--protein glycosyltransferase subunit 1-like n=1 Tax=Pecten maximus TaxID=6579 RepID=UPI001458DE51|nr:dolichyl-diphosphooligosaccharide--protein glycosyltransferase subunit 1-like [Pecten maximus]